MAENSPVSAHGRAVPVLHNATLPNGSVVDVHLERGRVRDIVPAAGRSAVGDELDLTGHLLLTAPAEPHAHLDKALTFDEIRPPMGDLGAAIAAWENHTPTLTVEGIAERARRAAMMLLGNGTTAVRSHVNLLRGEDPLRGIRALVEVREELDSVMDIQIVAMAPYFAEDGAVHAALDLGADLVGGHPHQTPDPSGNLQRLLAIARSRGVGVDMHTDEQLNPMMLTLEELAHSVRDWPKSMPVTAGHCVSLGVVQTDVLDRVIRAVKDSDVGIVSLPITNLYLQGWADPVATPRGLTAVRALLDAGVRVAGGADNVRDPYNPLGRSDALETAMLLVTAGHLSVDAAYRAVSEGARDIMGLPVAGVAAGLSADLLAIRSSSLEEAVASAPQDRIVLSQGRLVSISSTSRSCVAGG
ncbi:amidohydrolase family protein [Mycolicibacterium neworleansense]|uniref:Cytosine deaminase n=1 Tax=Mycolicibacterium neworleansense TaxID=146018 RepID=A0A0H5RNH1_9MYCO|nr:amidohydrolase family protein [Mycolicibacterium neworleansense]MCV7364926.1 amidohydrolase family protein [Mycolicibacterium neworleansense]CRZ15725.1 Cytosine deaminase [Mycolicibacterium neworleansense]